MMSYAYTDPTSYFYRTQNSWELIFLIYLQERWSENDLPPYFSSREKVAALEHGIISLEYLTADAISLHKVT